MDLNPEIDEVHIKSRVGHVSETSERVQEYLDSLGALEY